MVAGQEIIERILLSLLAAVVACVSVVLVSESWVGSEVVSAESPLTVELVISSGDDTGTQDDINTPVVTTGSAIALLERSSGVDDPEGLSKSQVTGLSKSQHVGEFLDPEAIDVDAYHVSTGLHVGEFIDPDNF